MTATLRPPGDQGIAGTGAAQAGPGSHWAHAVPAVAAALIGAVGVWAAWSLTIDDAFITWRYSANAAAGAGPTWNPGEDPVEGFTNFAWMAWHIPFAALGLDLAVVAKLTSALLAAITAALLLRHSGGRVGTATALGCYLLFLPTWFHITAGLETAAFALVLLRLVILGIQVLRGGEVRSWEPPLLLLAAGMLRPEGVAAAAPSLAVWLWHRRRSAAAWTWSAAAAAVGLAYFGWRWSYYGQLLPNTFYVKFGNLGAGVAWLEVTTAALLPLLVLAGALALRRDDGAVGLLVVVTVAATYAVYVVSGPSMDYLHRFAYHAFPLMCLAAGLALRDARRGVAATVAAATVGWVALAGLTANDLPTVVNYGPDLARTHVAIGQGLAAAAVPPSARVLASSDAGAIPYFSGWAALDYIGLNDEPITAGTDVDERMAQVDPTVLVVTGNGAEPAANAYGLDTAAATAGYLRVLDVRMRDNYSQHVFVTPAYAAAVRAALVPVVDAAQARNDPGRYDLTLDRWTDRLLR